MTTVREITKNDLAACIRLGARMHEESEYQAIEYSPEKCLALGLHAIDNNNMLWLVAESDGVIIGMLGAYIEQAYFSNETVAADFLVYVSQEQRGGMAFLKMVRRYVTWAKKQGAVLIFLRSSTGIRPEATAKIYERLGFVNVGNNFLLRGA